MLIPHDPNGSIMKFLAANYIKNEKKNKGLRTAVSGKIEFWDKRNINKILIRRAYYYSDKKAYVLVKCL